jgi:hypothetical protein
MAASRATLRSPLSGHPGHNGTGAGHRKPKRRRVTQQRGFFFTLSSCARGKDGNLELRWRVAALESWVAVAGSFLPQPDLRLLARPAPILASASSSGERGRVRDREVAAVPHCVAEVPPRICFLRVGFDCGGVMGRRDVHCKRPRSVRPGGTGAPRHLVNRCEGHLQACG